MPPHFPPGYMFYNPHMMGWYPPHGGPQFHPGYIPSQGGKKAPQNMHKNLSFGPQDAQNLKLLKHSSSL